jgi:hypothetical protein
MIDSRRIQELRLNLLPFLQLEGSSINIFET